MLSFNFAVALTVESVPGSPKFRGHGCTGLVGVLRDISVTQVSVARQVNREEPAFSCDWLFTFKAQGVTRTSTRTARQHVRPLISLVLSKIIDCPSYLDLFASYAENAYVSSL